MASVGVTKLDVAEPSISEGGEIELSNTDLGSADEDQLSESERIESEVNENTSDRSSSDLSEFEDVEDPGSETDFLDDEDEKEDYTQEEAIKELNQSKIEKYQSKLSRYEYSEDLTRSPSEQTEFDENSRKQSVEITDDPSNQEVNFFTNPNIVDDYYEIVINYRDGQRLELGRVMIAPIIVLDNGDIIKLMDELITLNRIGKADLNIQKFIPVMVDVGDFEYPGYQYTPMPSKYDLPTKIPRYDRRHFDRLKQDINRVKKIDVDARHFGIQWTGKEYRFLGRISNPSPPSDYREEIDLFTRYLNHLYSSKLNRSQLADIQIYLLP